MESIGQFTDYKKFLNSFFSSPKAIRGQRTRAAQAMGCQPAYLTQILKGKGDLTEDQAYRLTSHLEMTVRAAEYLMLLVRFARATTPELRKHLESKISQQGREISKQSRQLTPTYPSNELDPSSEATRRLHSSWIPSTVRALALCEKYRRPAAMAKRLGLSEKKVREVLAVLEQDGFVEKCGADHWKYIGGSSHIPKIPGFSAQTQIQRRLQALQSIPRELEDDLHISGVVAMSAERREQFREMMLKATKDSLNKIRGGKMEEVYVFCVDFFEA